LISAIDRRRAARKARVHGLEEVAALPAVEDVAPDETALREPRVERLAAEDEASGVLLGLQAVARAEDHDDPPLGKVPPVEGEAARQGEGQRHAVEPHDQVVAAEGGQRARGAALDEDGRRPRHLDLDADAVVDDAVRGLERADLAPVLLVEGGDLVGQQAAAGLGQLGEAPHVLEDGRARDRAPEAERVEGLVHGRAQVPGQGAHRAHPLPERLERERREARGQYLQVEVEPQPAPGEGLE
jgi:hypothetical protein